MRCTWRFLARPVRRLFFAGVVSLPFAAVPQSGAPAGGAGPDAPTDPGPTSSLHAAQQALARRDWNGTVSLGEAVVKSPAATIAERVAALRLQAKAEGNLNDFVAAGRTLRALLALRPVDAEALYLLGFTLERENKPRESLEVFTRAAALQNPSAEDLKLVGLDYVLLDDYGDALHWLSRSVALNPQNAEAWYDLGRTQMHEGQFPAAEASFRRTLTLEPGHVKAFDNLGLALEAQNRPEEAVEAYKAAIRAQETAAQQGGARKGALQDRTVEADPGKAPSQVSGARLNEQPLLNLGTLLNTRSDFGEADEVLARATEVAPRNPHCWEELARAEVGLGRNTEARAHMQRAIDLDPGNPRLHYQLGRIYRSLAMKAEADAEFARSSSLYGSHSSAPQP